MQRPGDAAREMFVIEYVSLQLEHQQQYDPGRRIDGCRECFDHICERYAIREPMGRCRPLLGKEEVNIERQQCINCVLKQLKEATAVRNQKIERPKDNRAGQFASKALVGLLKFRNMTPAAVAGGMAESLALRNSSGIHFPTIPL